MLKPAAAYAIKRHEADALAAQLGLSFCHAHRRSLFFSTQSKPAIDDDMVVRPAARLQGHNRGVLVDGAVPVMLVVQLKGRWCIALEPGPDCCASAVAVLSCEPSTMGTCKAMLADEDYKIAVQVKAICL